MRVFSMLECLCMMHEIYFVSYSVLVILLRPRETQEMPHRAEQGRLHTCRAKAPRPGRGIRLISVKIERLVLSGSRFYGTSAQNN